MYTPSWDSLGCHPLPEWVRYAKFGIYTHWGPYCVPAFGPNVTWYPLYMYQKGSEQYDHHRKRFGPQSEFGYKDFIPMMTGDRFDADEWAELFRDAGARFAGPVGMHHDGFCMWDSAYTEWNAKRMGPKRDVVGELERAIRSKGMKFFIALHHAENWWFYPHWDRECDCSDPRWQGLYGAPHDTGYTGNPMDWVHGLSQPDQAFLDRWLALTNEAADKYRPDLLWFDFGLEYVQEQYKLRALAHYYEQARISGRQVTAISKFHHLAPGCALTDIEQGSLRELAHYPWITDTTVDDGQAWGYMENARYKSTGSIVRTLIDNVSKNGALLLNVGPDRHGSIPPEAREILRGIGAWLRLNGEGIFDTVPWLRAGEGPTVMEKEGTFNESELPFTQEDFRFTCRGRDLYAFCMAVPNRDPVIRCLGTALYPDEIESVTMTGSDRPLPFRLDRETGLTIGLPDLTGLRHAVCFRIRRRDPFR